jgi:pSer/pThr/pTyr-binding forkhead associated (FHA) protein
VSFALTIAAGSARGQRFRFEGESVSIGRAPDNDVVLNDAGVSRTHARIERRASEWVLTDRASANGVALNGAAVVTAAPLREGDRIAVGPVTFEFRPGLQKTRWWHSWSIGTSRPAHAGLVALTVLIAGIAVICATESGQGIPMELRDGGPSGSGRGSPGTSSGDLVAARAVYERGRRKLAERRVAPRNLYDAWAAFVAAADHLRGATGAEPLRAEVQRLVSECERDLRRECQRLLFTAARFERYGQHDRAQRAWREVLLHYPGDDPAGCRHRAEESVVSSQPDLGVE